MENAKEIIRKYCEATNSDVTDVLNKKKDRKTVEVRDALIYLAWEKEKPKINHKNKKSYVLERIAKSFNMKRHSVYERIQKIDSEIKIYKGDENIRKIREIVCKQNI